MLKSIFFSEWEQGSFESNLLGHERTYVERYLCQMSVLIEEELEGLKPASSFRALCPRGGEEIPCRDVHLARCLQFAMHKFRLSLFVKDLEPGGSTTFCFLIA